MLFSVLTTLLLLTSQINAQPRVQILGVQDIQPQQDLSFPIKDPNMLGVKIEASSAVVLDLETGEILFAKNADQPRAIASLTKIMTVLTALEKPNLNLADIYTVTRTASKIKSQGSDINLNTGEKVTVHNLIRGALISSGNDAALALAEYIAGDEGDFVEQMNHKAKSLGLINTNFANPHGLDDPNNYSTAYEVAKIAQQAYQNQVFRENIALTKFNFKSLNSRRTHRLYNTNKLLDNSFLDILGGKTGTTNQAGECLMLIAENEDGHKIVSVLLNSPDRFTESKILIDWVFKAYTW